MTETAFYAISVEEFTPAELILFLIPSKILHIREPLKIGIWRATADYGEMARKKSASIPVAVCKRVPDAARTHKMLLPEGLRIFWL
ncbi:MAG TPA: hypothetical protein DCZ94_05745 [Lentisphaeria bacterium]|nr:MAG: hypothetical protein A2X48_07265 [Lentisphaerae bacterium GWF2_49_21]HBC86438.1 hypothetical protein [Lentisphaeria bacterium]